MRSDLPPVSSGFPALDAATGVGGFPAGSIVQLFGPDVALVGGIGWGPMVFGAEPGKRSGARILRPVAAEILDSLDVPAEHALDALAQAVASGLYRVVILDHVGKLPGGEVDPAIGAPAGAFPGDTRPEITSPLARAMATALRRLVLVAERTGTVVVLVTPEAHGRVVGGNAAKYYSHLRIRVVVDERGATVAKVVKNKFAPPFTEAVLGTPRAEREVLFVSPPCGPHPKL